MYRTADRFGTRLTALVLGAAVTAPLPEPPVLSHGPVVWYADDRRDVAPPESRSIGVVVDALREIAFRPVARATHPGRLVREIGALFGGEEVPPARNVNRLDEALNSTWFTNRLGLFPIAPGRAAAGPGDASGPARDGPWTVVSAKTEGVTPGFTIRDSRGDRYLIKFDPPGHPGMTTAAGVITGRILWAAGYNVPADAVVTLRRDRLVLGPDVTIPGPGDRERLMTPEDLTRILDRVEHRGNEWRALASRILEGTVLGPFDWQGTRSDDPNDRIRHENRRELRGFRVFAAWLCHFDTKRLNTMDVWVEEGDRRFVRHYFIDFASTLGAGARGPSRKHCFEYTVDGGAMVERALTLGWKPAEWRALERPEGLEEIGYFESEIFDPLGFHPYQGNAAFANLTDRDGYWAAKVISAFTDEHLAAMVEEGRYRNQGAARYMTRTLAERRDLIARAWFDRMPPLDFFAVREGRLSFRDLGTERGIYDPETTRYRYRTAPTDARGSAGEWSRWADAPASEVRLPSSPEATDSRPFLAVRLQVSREGEGWSDPVTVYVSRRNGRIAGVDR